MTIRFKLVLLMALAVVALALGACLYSQQVVERAITDAELATVRHDARLAMNMYRSELDVLLRQGREWASDPGVIAAADGGTTAFDNAAVDARLTEQKVDLVILVSDDGAVVESRSLARGADKGAVPDSVLDFIAKDSRLRVHHHADSTVKGLATLPSGVFLLVSLPVRPSDPGSLIRGALILGRNWEQAEFYRIAKDSGFSVFQQGVAGSLSPDFQEARERLRGGEDVYVKVLGTTSCAAYTLLDDIYDEPALLLRLTRPRASHMLALRAGGHVGLFILAAGALLTVLAVLLLEVTVLSRLRRLVREVRALKNAEHTFEAHVTVNGDDEVGKLGQGIHYLLSGMKTHRLRWIRAERRLQTLLEVSPTPILFADPQSGKLRRANSGALLFLGAKSRRDLHDKTVADVVDVGEGPDGMAALFARFDEKSHPMPAVIRCLDGRQAPVLLNGRKMSLDDDELVVISFVSGLGTGP